MKAESGIGPERSLPVRLQLVFGGRPLEKVSIPVATGGDHQGGPRNRPSPFLVSELRALAGARFGLNVNRIRLTIREKQSGKPVIVLEDKKPLLSYDVVVDGAQVVVKDLGPQISWTTVFIIEYLGPILIHLAFYMHSVLVRGVCMSPVQNLAFACVCGHFLKREYETLFVHRFSLATMPFTNLFKNCGHYWLLSGFLIAYFLYSADYVAPSVPFVVVPAFVAFLAAEVGNYHAHLTLRNLRPPGSTKRGIPRGGLFRLVSCPNYTYEIGAWVSFSLMTGLVSSWFFTLVSFAQIYLWAVKKHRRYLSEFVTYPKNRKALIPYLL